MAYKDPMLRNVFHGLDIWATDIFFTELAGFQSHWKPMDRLALISAGRLLDQLCKEDTFCLKAWHSLKSVWGCGLGCQKLWRTWTISLCSLEGIQLAHDSPHHPPLHCLVPSWAVALPVSALKHSPGTFSALEGEMEMRGNFFLFSYSTNKLELL